MGGQLPASELPSQQYYNNNLRAASEWEDDGGPGGSGVGENQGVGVNIPLGGVTPVISCVIIYGVYIYTRKKNKLI